MEFLAAALIAGLATIIAAWLNNRRGKATLAELRPNSGGSMRDLLDRVAGQVMVIHTKVDAVAAEQTEFRSELAEFRSEKQAATEESIRMWRAIEAVAKSEPPV